MSSSASAQQRIFRCPRCGKEFGNSTSVTRHMKQPRSACAQSARLTQVSLPAIQAGDLEHEMGMDHDATVGLNVEPDDNDIDTSEDSRSYYSPERDLDNNNGAARNAFVDAMGGAPFKAPFPEAAASYGRGSTFMDQFDLDQFSEERQTNLYYPFAWRGDWEVGQWLLRSGLSMALIDEFMSLEVIRNLAFSFKNAKDLRNRAELLPSGPKWMRMPIRTINPTKSPISLYHRDPLECLKMLMRNPLHADVLELAPYHLYRDMERSVRLFSEWLTGETAWQMQEKLPKGATLLGTVLSSDKTVVSIMTGNHTAYPLLISLANIKKHYRLKNSHDTFLLLALLPVAKFIHRNRRTRSLLQDQLTHSCLDIVLAPLKLAALQGSMMTDPLGYQRLCYPAIASYTVDTPEAQLLAGVGARSSPVTMAHYKDLGSPVRQATRTSSNTLLQLNQLIAAIDSSDDYVGILREASKLHLNGVLLPFWQNWFLAEPSIFLTPEPLHHFHKEFWDHDLRWCINIIGSELIDYLFSILQPRVGFRQFKEGISNLKQVTGRDHREIQRYIIPIIALIAPEAVVLSIRSLMDVRYLSQSPVQDMRSCTKIQDALDIFHRHKDSIIAAGGRLGKGGVPINHFLITKLELYHNVVPSIMANGSIEQWTADITEHAHHTDIKVPARSGNNHNYDSQILRTLDRLDKMRRFDLATSIRDAGVSLRAWVVGDDDDAEEADEELLDNAASLASRIAPVSKKILGSQRVLVNYFAAAERLRQGTHHYRTTPPKPHRVFSSDSVAFQLSRDPPREFKSMTIDAASEQLLIPDFRRSLVDFVSHLHRNGDVPCRVGGRRGACTSALSFDTVQIWTRVRVQCRAFHYPHDILPSETLLCLPPSLNQPNGVYDSVLVNTDAECQWPRDQMNGHSVVQLRLIFRAVPPKGSNFISGLDGFLAYVQRFDVIPQVSSSNGSIGLNPDPLTGMYALRRSLRADGSRQGSIIQLRHIRRPLMLVPRFRREVDPRLTGETCNEYHSEFWLNDYFDKETYYSFRSGIF